MAGSFSLNYGATTITLSPLSNSSPGFDIDHGLIINTMLDGSIQTQTNFVKQKASLEVNNVSKANADYINSWKQNAYTLVYMPDTNTPGTTYNVIITNSGKPLLWMPNVSPDTKFEGVISLREV